MMLKRLLKQLKAARVRLAVAESCTGGMIAAAITSVAGSSDVFDRGFVTYSNEAKHDLLGVPKSLIAKHGAVSAQVAVAMAEGALKHSLANAALSVTGIAGPGGGSIEKPVGLVFCALAVKRKKTVHIQLKFGNIGRRKVRTLSVASAIGMLERLTSRENVFGPEFKR
jgi:nicotinamide-nucleotide amidase